MVHHKRKTYKKYLKNKNSNHGCPFCGKDNLKNIVYEDEFVAVVHNITKYDYWELLDVEEHLMVVPLRHVETIDELTDEEKLRIMNIIAKYDKLGYNTYARGLDQPLRSVKHQHTHLLKTGKKVAKLTFYSSFPYIIYKW